MRWKFWKKKHKHFHISKDKYGELVDFLDGHRDDQRKSANNENSRPVKDEFLLTYSERKGYVEYLFTGGSFVRTISKEGYKILSFMNYEDYLEWRAEENAKTWYPIRIAFFALLVAIYAAVYSTCNEAGWKDKELIEQRVEQLDSSLKSLTDHLNAYRQPSKEYTSNANPLKNQENIQKETAKKDTGQDSAKEVKK